MMCKCSIKLSESIFSKSFSRCSASMQNGISTNSTDDYQFIQKSKVPTLHFQEGLFRLPIPKLEKTCERYLNALKPLLNDRQFEQTRKLVNKFETGEGKDLHEALKMKDNNNKHTSYISKPWFDMYLKDRAPLPLNYNPAIVFNRSKHSASESQLSKATNLTIASLRFMRSLKNNFLSPAIFFVNPKAKDSNFINSWIRFLPSKFAVFGAYMQKAYPLDMSQFPSLFNSTRIPKLNKDVLVRDDSGKHILILKNGNFFKFDVLDENGDILPAEDIFTCFKHVLDKDLKLNNQSVGILTSENRDIWAKARQHLIFNKPNNLDVLKTIDTALFVLCLDDEPVGENPDTIMRTFLLGNGFNRWFDKSFSVIISKDGVAAVNFEHSWGDGVAVLRYIMDVYDDINIHPFTSSSTKKSSILVEKYLKKLEFDLDDESLHYIKEAKQKFEKVHSSLRLNVVEETRLGRTVCASANVISDALMQLSFQVAYHKVYGEFVSTYESCSTSGFKHGRTEAIRPCTEATKDFALKFNSQNRPGKGDLKKMLIECSEQHKMLTKDALMGQGFDRHLFGLKCIAEEQGRPLPDIYTDEAYRILNYNKLSTSTLVSDAILVGGFGPVVPDGLGVGYTIGKSKCGALISSYAPAVNGDDFATALKSTLDEFFNICNS